MYQKEAFDDVFLFLLYIFFCPEFCGKKKAGKNGGLSLFTKKRPLFNAFFPQQVRPLIKRHLRPRNEKATLHKRLVGFKSRDHTSRPLIGPPCPLARRTLEVDQYTRRRHPRKRRFFFKRLSSLLLQLFGGLIEDGLRVQRSIWIIHGQNHQAKCHGLLLRPKVCVPYVVETMLTIYHSTINTKRLRPLLLRNVYRFLRSFKRFTFFRIFLKVRICWWHFQRWRKKGILNIQL